MSNHKLYIPPLFNITSTNDPDAGTFIEDLFDGNKSNYIQINNSNNDTTITLTSNNSKITLSKININTYIASIYIPIECDIKLYYEDNLIEEQLENTLSLGDNYFSFSTGNRIIDKIEIIFTDFASFVFFILGEIELFGANITPTYEFNDYVLETHAWNSSRYTGKQLQGTSVNTYVNGDITYGKTPVIRNNVRTFYTATEIVSLSKSGSAKEDPTLQYIPDFSYIVVDKAFTINDDNSVTVLNVNDFTGKIVDEKKFDGFKREFQTNIPIGSKISLLNLDASARDRGGASYDVYFNRGRLQPFLRIKRTNPDSSALTYNVPFNYFTLDDGEVNNINISLYSTNNRISQLFYTGSYFSLPKSSIPRSILVDILSNIANSNYNIYITALQGSGSDANGVPLVDPSVSASYLFPIRTIEEDAGYYPSKDLRELSTIQTVGLRASQTSFNCDTKFKLSQNYNSNTPNYYSSGSIELSVLNEDKPSLLLNLNKESEFPDGKGNKSMIVLPEDLHPFIKNNIIHFCVKGGIEVGDIKEVPTLNTTYQNLL